MLTEKYVMEQGYNLIGQGYYSRVYGKDGHDRIYKFGSNDNWPDYIDWAARNDFLGTFVPRVFEIEIDIGYVAQVERCRPMTAFNYQPEDRFYHDVIKNFRKSIKNEDCPSLPVNWIPFAEAFKQAFSNESSSSSDLKAENWLVRPDGSLCLNDPVHDHHCKLKGNHRYFDVEKLKPVVPAVATQNLRAAVERLDRDRQLQPQWLQNQTFPPRHWRR